jgi:hypothetical protein
MLGDRSAVVAGDPQHRDHQQVADGEAVAFEPLVVTEPVGDPAEALDQLRAGARLAQLGPFLAGVEGVQRGEAHHEWLDAVQRRIGPLDSTGSGDGVARKQPLILVADVLDDGAAFEQLQIAFAIGRHLAEGLFTLIAGRDRPDGANGIVEPRFLQRPADAKVANLASRKRRNPAEGGELDGSLIDQRHGSGLLERVGGRGGGRVHPHHFPMVAVGILEAATVHDLAHLLLGPGVHLGRRLRRPCDQTSTASRLSSDRHSSTWLVRWASAISLA